MERSKDSNPGNIMMSSQDTTGVLNQVMHSQGSLRHRESRRVEHPTTKLQEISLKSRPFVEFRSCEDTKKEGQCKVLGRREKIERPRDVALQS